MPDKKPDINKLLSTVQNPNSGIPEDVLVEQNAEVDTQPERKKGVEIPKVNPYTDYAKGIGAEAYRSYYREPDGNVTDPKDVSSLDDAINYLKGKADSIHVETPDERKARERRERRTMWLSHLADGLGSFHTAYSHAAGVQPMQLQNMSDKAWERMEKARIAREGNEDRRLKYLQLMNTLEGQKNTWQYQRQKLDMEQKKYAAEQARKEALTQAQRNAYMARQKKDEALAAKYQAEADALAAGYDPEQAKIIGDLKAEEIRSRINKNNAQAAAAGKKQNNGEYSETTEVEYDRNPYGGVTRQKTTKTRTRNGNGDTSPDDNGSTRTTNSNQQGGNRPPSRRNNNNNNNRPPSRR